MKIAIVFAAFIAAACSVAEGDGATAAAAPAEEQSLEGTYLVSFVNGEKPLINIEGQDPTVTITPGRIHFQSQCTYHDWSFTRDGEQIRTGPFTYPESDGLVGMCARGLAIGEEAIETSFAGAREVRRVRSGLWFDGEGGTIQLKRLPDKQELAARDLDLTGWWNVEAIDDKPLAFDLPLEADFNEIWWEPGCAGQSVRYTIDRSAFSVIPHKGPEMVCEIGYPPELTATWAAMRAANSVEKSDNGGVLMSGGGRSVLLAPRVGG